MGVPKFYRWLSERYPCLSEVVCDSQIPEFDNLYIDMNGIIHNCSHPNNDSIAVKIPEEQIFRDIFYYIETLFGIICPKKVFFMAVDGVAPRAKMNQQRARRFMSAKNAEMAVKISERKGIAISEKERFDSNCITPGTPFMANLHTQLQYFIQYKISTDPAWQGIRIYYSGHDCPGEGEHKIMDFIRSERSQPNYDPNTRHCLYGLDADLIMLSVCSHEPHVSLLREEVQFGRPSTKTQKIGVDGTTFHLLHISLLREYLGMEFEPLKDKVSFKYDIEAVIDDWVLMGLLIGNDFIPHLPYVDIQQDGYDRLYAAYIEILPQLGGYINESGVLNLKRFEAFLKLFAKNDRKCFFGEMNDIKYLESKRCPNEEAFRSKRLMEKKEQDLIAFELSDDESDKEVLFGEDESKDIPRKGAFDSDSDEGEGSCVDNSHRSEEVKDDGDSQIFASASEALEGFSEDILSSSVKEQLEVFDVDEDYDTDYERMWTKSVNRAFKDHKRNYYCEKLKYVNITKEELHEQAECYIRAIQWNLHYYYHGCCSWSWFYPHHYAPYISDVTNFSDVEMNFEMSEPFHPFEQLLAVLPAASADCLPKPLQELMLDENSPIRDFYPQEFSTDLNGKKNDWESVVLIPFIDEKRLLEAVATKIDRLTPEERFRNSFGPHLLYTTDLEHPKRVLSTFPGVFEDLINCVAKKEEVPMDAFRIEKSKIITGLLPGVKLDIYFPGFPTTQHIKYTPCLRDASICVFRQPSLKKSMVMTIQRRPEFEREMSSVASELLGTEVHVEWPLLRKGLVSQLWVKTTRWYLDGEEKIVSESLNDTQRKSYEDYCNCLFKKEFKRYGIEICQRKAIVFVRRLLGASFIVSRKKLVCKKYWEDEHEAKPYSLELIVQNALEDRRKNCSIQSVEEGFPVGCTAFFSNPSTKFYGCRVEVESNDILKKQFGMLKVRCVLPSKHIDFTYLNSNLKNYSIAWFHIEEVARKTSLSISTVNRITGYIPMNITNPTLEDPKVNSERINIGLDLKNPKKNLAIPDYARRSSDGWDYSFLTLRTILKYRKKFPEIFHHLESPTRVNEAYKADYIWPNVSKKKKRLQELRKFLSSIPSASCDMEPSDGVYLDSHAIKKVEKIVATTPSISKMKRLGVKSYMLFRPELHTGGTMPDGGTKFALLDRVICVRPICGAPYGAYGTVIGITGTDNNCMVEVLFDDCYLGGRSIRRSKRSSSRLPPSALIDITYGNRVRAETNECKEEESIAGTEKLTFWGPNFCHPSVHKLSLPVMVDNKRNLGRDGTSTTYQKSVAETSSATAQSQPQKIILLKKEVPSIKEDSKGSSVVVPMDAYSTSEEKVNTELLCSDTSCIKQDAEKFKDCLKTATETGNETPTTNAESTGLNKKQLSTISSSGAFGEFKTCEKDCEKRFEDLLKKLKLDNRNNALCLEQGPPLMGPISRQEPVKTHDVQHSSNADANNCLPLRTGTEQLTKLHPISRDGNYQPEVLNFRPPPMPANFPIQQQMPFPFQVKPPLLQQSHGLQTAVTREQFSSMSQSFGCRHQLKPGFCKIKLLNQPRPYFSPKQPPAKGCVNFPFQPQWHLQSTAGRFRSPRFRQFPYNRQPLASSAMNNQAGGVGTAGSFSVPSDMTPTQVIRRKLPLNSLKDNGLASSLASCNDVNDNTRVGRTGKSLRKELNSERGTEEIKSNDDIDGNDFEKLDNRNSCSPDLDSIPDLKIQTETTAVVTNSSNILPNSSASTANIHNRVDVDKQKELSEKSSAPVASKPKFKFLGGRKSRLAAKFS